MMMQQKPPFQVSRRSIMGVMAASALCPPSAFAQSNSASRALKALLERSEAADSALDPLTAVRNGKPVAGPLFVDPLSDLYGSMLRGNKTRDLAELNAIDRAALSPVERIAFDVFDYNVRQTLTLFQSGLFEVQRKAPLNPSFGLHIEFPDFLSGGGAALLTPDDYDDTLARIEGFVGYMHNNVARLKEGLADGYLQPKIIVTNILSQVDAMLALPVEDSPFWSAVTLIPATFVAAERERITRAFRTIIIDQVYPAYRAWSQFLRGTYMAKASDEPGLWAMKGGDALYRWNLARHTTTTRSPDDIHALGVAEVTRIRGEMEKVRRRIGFDGNLKAFFEHVRTDPQYYCKTPAELLGRFKAIEAKIWPAIPRLFHDRPKAPFEVRALPALGDQRGTGYYQSGPPDGVSPGILFFNMSMLNTRPIPTLETLTLHEGIPGHHFQRTLTLERPDLPSLLRYGDATAFTEGWGLYAESLGTELGMFSDPMQLFGHLDMEMLRAVRLVVDTGLHAHRWTRQQAIDYMLDNTSMAPRDVVVEIDRYITYPGQACAYKVGELKIRDLREDARNALGTAFDVRDYHAQVLNSGALPLDVLDAKIRTWIKAGGGRV